MKSDRLDDHPRFLETRDGCIGFGRDDNVPASLQKVLHEIETRVRDRKRAIRHDDRGRATHRRFAILSYEIAWRNG